MTRPLTRNQTLENHAFLKVLTRTGNIREAVRETGLKHGTMFYRRAKHPAFALQWDAAVAVADARLRKGGGTKGPDGVCAAEEAHPLPLPEGREGREGDRGDPLRTRGGEPTIVRRRDGKLQVRRAQPGKVTVQAEQAFLSALSATANVTLAAAAVGVAEAAFYRRRRRNAGFAREMQLALEMGYERIEAALLESTLVGAHEHDAWRHNAPPPIPPMTPDQALQLLCLHHKTAKLWAEHEELRRRPGESGDALSMRLSLMYQAKVQRERERWEIGLAERRSRGERSAFDPPLPVLPELGQVRPRPHERSEAAHETPQARPAGAKPPTDDAGFARGGAGGGPRPARDGVKGGEGYIDRFGFPRKAGNEGATHGVDAFGFARRPAAEGEPERRTGLADGRVSVKRPGVALFGGWRIKGGSGGE